MKKVIFWSYALLFSFIPVFAYSQKLELVKTNCPPGQERADDPKKVLSEIVSLVNNTAELSHKAPDSSSLTWGAYKRVPKDPERIYTLDEKIPDTILRVLVQKRFFYTEKVTVSLQRELYATSHTSTSWLDRRFRTEIKIVPSDSKMGYVQITILSASEMLVSLNVNTPLCVANPLNLDCQGPWRRFIYDMDSYSYVPAPVSLQYCRTAFHRGDLGPIKLASEEVAGILKR